MPEGVNEVGAVIEQVTEKVKKLGDSIAENFTNRMIDAVQGGKNAFQGFFSWLKNKLVEMAIKFLLFKALIGISGSENMGQFAEGITGFKSATATTTDTADLKANVIVNSSASARDRGMVVNQNINFTVSAIDARDATRFIQEQGGTIAQVVATAAKDSTAYRRQLQGA